MKSTGCIRIIDDLGRILIPKEVRKELNINEGESFEIFIDENRVVLEKVGDINRYYESLEKNRR